MPTITVLRNNVADQTKYLHLQDAAERTLLCEKRINSKLKKIQKCFFYFWKAHEMPFYTNVFGINYLSSGGLEY